MKYLLSGILLAFSLYSCENIKNDESLYFLYYGSLKPSVKHLVIKKSHDSYYENLMELGYPKEYLFDCEEFENIKSCILRQKYSRKNTSKFTRGLLVLHFKGKNQKSAFIFTNKNEVDSLVFRLSNFTTQTNKQKNIIDWIKGIQNLHIDINTP